MATADTAHRRMFAPGSTALATSPPRLIHKRSDSVPDGRYRTSPANSLAPGDLMLVHLLLEECNGCAARLPAGECNAIEDRGGDGAAAHVHARESGAVHINGVLIAWLLRRDRQGRALPAWQTCRRLAGDELLLLSSTNPKSFDSRYGVCRWDDRSGAALLIGLMSMSCPLSRRSRCR